MSLIVKCPGCALQLGISEEMRGKLVCCSNCKSEFQVGTQPTAPAMQPAAPPQPVAPPQPNPFDGYPSGEPYANSPTYNHSPNQTPPSYATGTYQKKTGKKKKRKDGLSRYRDGGILLAFGLALVGAGLFGCLLVYWSVRDGDRLNPKAFIGIFAAFSFGFPFAFGGIKVLMGIELEVKP